MEKEKDLVGFNINNYVYVKLNEKGFQHLVDDWNMTYQDMIIFGPKTIDDFKAKCDENGYMKFQMLDLISKFGGTMRLGSLNCFDMQILFEIKDLVKKI